MKIENATIEQLVEFFGGEINVVDGKKVWTSPEHPFEHPKYICKIAVCSNKDFSKLIIVAEKKQPKEESFPDYPIIPKFIPQP